MRETCYYFPVFKRKIFSLEYTILVGIKKDCMKMGVSLEEELLAGICCLGRYQK